MLQDRQLPTTSTATVVYPLPHPAAGPCKLINPAANEKYALFSGALCGLRVFTNLAFSLIFCLSFTASAPASAPEGYTTVRLADGRVTYQKCIRKYQLLYKRTGCRLIITRIIV